MAARITQQQIEQINEVYCKCRVKTQTAKIVGVSVASVTKYLIDGYIPKAARVKYDFDGRPNPVTAATFITDWNDLDKFALMIDEEWEELRELQEAEIDW